MEAASLSSRVLARAVYFAKSRATEIHSKKANSAQTAPDSAQTAPRQRPEETESYLEK